MTGVLLDLKSYRFVKISLMDALKTFNNLHEVSGCECLHANVEGPCCPTARRIMDLNEALRVFRV